MSGLSQGVGWTRRVGYSYPLDIFQAALKATYPRLTDTEVRHCLAEYEREQAEWAQRVEAREFSSATDEAGRRA